MKGLLKMEINVNKNLFEKYTPKDVLDKIVKYDSISEMWEDVVKKFSSLKAISSETVNKTYKDIDVDISHFRSLLNEKGIKKGDFVGIYSPNSYDFVKGFLSVTTLGGVAVLIPPQLPLEVVNLLTMKYSMKGLLFNSCFEEKFNQFNPLNKDTKVINLNESSLNLLNVNKVNGKDPCCILFTGGTTGKSKGALLNNKAILTGAINGFYGYQNVFNQRYLLVLPLTHVFGLVRNLMTSLCTGSDFFIVSNNKDMFKNIAMHRPTIMVMVPALAEMALNLSKQFNKNMLGDDLKVIICGATQVPPFLIQEYMKIGIQMLPGYGLTESANLVTGNPEIVKKPDSVGLPYEGQILRIVNGELQIKGANIMDSYYNDEDNATAFTEDGFFKTGDLVRIDDEGFIYIVGRTKEIIVLSTGENISPAELENKFNEEATIQDSLIYLKDGILTLQVYPRMGEIKNKNIEDVEGYIKSKVNEINDKLFSYQRIQKVIIRSKDFARTPAMKIIRGAANENDY